MGTAGDKYAYCCINADWDQRISFEYEVENHQSSTYSARIEASVWQEDEKLLDLFSQDVAIKPFGEAIVVWALSSEDLGIAALAIGESYQYTVPVNRGDVERRIIVSFYNPQESPFPKPVPSGVR